MCSLERYQVWSQYLEPEEGTGEWFRLEGTLQRKAGRPWDQTTLLRAGAWKILQGWRVTAQPLCVTCSMPDYTHGEVGFSYFWSELLIWVYACCLLSSHRVPRQGTWLPLPADVLTGIGRHCCSVLPSHLFWDFMRAYSHWFQVIDKDVKQDRSCCRSLWYSGCYIHLSIECDQLTMQPVFTCLAVHPSRP